MTAALFVASSSVYRQLGCDCYDIDRDARTFGLDQPAICHPPCRAWGQLSHMAKPRADEKDLAPWSIHVVRHCGGVVEHPAASRLWSYMGIKPGVRDSFGGLLLVVDQVAWGHPARKRTGLYLVGRDLVPRIGGTASRTVESQSRAQRMQTPPQLAADLVAIFGGPQGLDGLVTPSIQSQSETPAR